MFAPLTWDKYLLEINTVSVADSLGIGPRAFRASQTIPETLRWGFYCGNISLRMQFVCTRGANTLFGDDGGWEWDQGRVHGGRIPGESEPSVQIANDVPTSLH